MMITISSENSLLLWAQNRNHVNNIAQNIGDKSYDFFMADLFLGFFNNLKNSFNNPNNIKISFCKEWQKVNNVFYIKSKNKIKDFFKCTDEEATKIINKVRGNIGEIFAEAFFSKLGNKWIKANTYTPVDPTNERFVDARAIMNDGIKCGIQIKNHKGEIDSSVFLKASFEDRIALSEIADKDEILKYLERKRQFLFSFSDNKYSPNMDAYTKIIKIIGPNDIDAELTSENNTLRVDIINEIIGDITNAKFE